MRPLLILVALTGCGSEELDSGLYAADYREMDDISSHSQRYTSYYYGDNDWSGSTTSFAGDDLFPSSSTSYWSYSSSYGYYGDMRYTTGYVGDGEEDDYWAFWQWAPTTRTGRVYFEVYIPNNYADANATYYYGCDLDYYSVSKDQRSYSNVWVALGSLSGVDSGAMCFISGGKSSSASSSERFGADAVRMRISY